MNRFKKALLVLTVLGVCGAARAADHHVVTTLPVSQLLSESLLAGTDIEPMYLPPKRLPVKRIASWLKSKSTERIQKAGPFDALITVESIWPQFAAYGKVRTGNIRVVPIDIAQELNEPGSRVRRSANPAHQRHYFWLDTDNLLVMGQILARDLGSLWPDQLDQIRKNLQSLTQDIQAYSANIDKVLLDNEVMALCVKAADLKPLAQASFLPLEQESGCEEDALKLGRLTSNSRFTANLWLVDALERPIKGGLNSWLEANLKRLRDALAERDGK